MPAPRPGSWHCFACNTDTELERVVCGVCHRPRPREVDAPATIGATPVSVLREIEAPRAREASPAPAPPASETPQAP